MARRHRVALALLIGCAIAGCYKPNVRDGGLLCADAGVCPEGFHCAPDGTCHKGPKMACPAASPHIAPLCQPSSGSPCDPICQGGCECGRCNLVGTGLMCVPPGTKQRGDVCDVANDNCAPGNTCLAYCGAGKPARCYRFCGKGDVQDPSLCGGNNCDISVNPGGQPEWKVCEPPLESCNPIGDNNDCVAPTTYGCYVGPTGEPVCDCRGTVPGGAVCGFYNACLPGFSCLALQAGQDALCFKTCLLLTPDCPAATTCTPLPGNDTYGFCRP
jgi:hypothetical protein